MERRLSAILAADVVGYSLLMGDDEEATYAALQDLRTTFLEPLVSQHRGRIVDFIGDNALVEFASVVEAVECAVSIQAGLAERNAEAPHDRQINLRIGINLGDIIAEGNNIYGDGVNVAARLEGLADAGGICVSRAAYEQVRDKLDLTFEDRGEIEVKNIARPIQVFTINTESPTTQSSHPVKPKPAFQFNRVLAICSIILVGLVTMAWWQPWSPDVAPVRSEKLAFPLPQIPSIAVMAFENLGEESGPISLSDAISENIITELSRVRELFVIARNSSFAYKGKTVEARKVAEELGVRYLVAGSLQKSGERLRVTVRLTDALAGNHIWGERYDREIEDVFKIQDDISQTVVAQISETVKSAEIKNAALKHPSSLKAFEYRMLALKAYVKWTKEGNEESRQFLLKALEIDPEYARAHGGLAWVYINGYRWGWSELSRPDALERAREHAKKALKLDPFDSFNHSAMAEVYNRSGDLEQALSQYQRANQVNPNDDRVLANMTDPLIFLGRNEEGLEAIQRAIRLNPHHPDWYYWSLGWAQYYNEQYEEALVTMKKMANIPNRARLILAAIYVRNNMMDEARATIAEFLKNDPDYKLADDWNRSKHRSEFNKKRVFDDVRAAGIPG